MWGNMCILFIMYTHIYVIHIDICILIYDIDIIDMLDNFLRKIEIMYRKNLSVRGGGRRALV